MEEKEYLNHRVNEQIQWYSTKSSTNKRLHYATRGSIIFFSALIPFISGFLETGPVYLNYVVGVLGMLVAVLTGISTLVKFQEKWVKYRATSIILKQEKFLYLNKSGHYRKVTDEFDTFVYRIERILSKENDAWVEIMNNEDE